MTGLDSWPEVAQWAFIAGYGVILVGVLYLVADTQRRLGPDRGVFVPNDGLGIGDAAPPLVTLDRRTGAAIDLAAYGDGTVVMAFLSPTCKPCVALVPAINRISRFSPHPIIVAADDGETVQYSTLLAPSIALIDSPATLTAAFKASRTPMVYRFDRGIVAMRGIPNDLIGLQDLVDGVGALQGNREWRPSERSRDVTS